MIENIKQVRRYVRRFLGIELLLEKLDVQRQATLEVLSLLKYSVVDLEKVTSSVTYKRCAEIVALLSPMDVKGGRYVRVGRSNDGGYVMLDNFSNRSVDAAYSFGINDDVSWDESIAEKGIDVLMFDHTIDCLPKNNSRFHFSKIGVTGHNRAENVETLAMLLHRSNHATSKNLILKMDVEGCEWDVFNETSTETIAQFSQIVLELHSLCPIRGDAHHALIVNALRKINVTHQSVHVHANVNCIPLWIADKVLPDMMEVTFVRRSDVENLLVKCTRAFPTSLDQPTFYGRADLHLGAFS